MNVMEQIKKLKLKKQKKKLLLLIQSLKYQQKIFVKKTKLISFKAKRDIYFYTGDNLLNDKQVL